MVGAPFPAGELAAAAEQYEEQIDEFLARDDDLARYVQRLELMGDDESDGDDDEVDDVVISDVAGSDLDGPERMEANAERMMEDIERFLRDQGNG